MRKHFLIIFLLITFYMFIPNVEAAYGDVRYNITSVQINGSEITFNGWAFIHRTNNSKSTNQNITITAYKGNTVIATKEANGSGDYNFYWQHCYKGSNGCIVQYGTTSDVVMWGINYGKYNTCNNNSDSPTNCVYEDLGFSIKFDTTNWSSGDVNFKIKVSNNSYNSSEIPIGVMESAIQTTGNEYIKVNTASISSEGKFIAEEGMYTNPNTSSYYTATCNGNQTRVIGDVGKNYTITKMINAQRLTANSKSYRDSVYYDSGYYELKTAATTCHGTTAIASPGTSVTRRVPASWIIPTGTFTIKVQQIKKCPLREPEKKELSCNNTNKLTSTCGELTVSGNDGNYHASATVEMTQEGIISNILTPTELFAGGGYKFGIMYYNTFKWNFANSGNILCTKTSNGNTVNCTASEIETKGKTIIRTAMRNKIKDLATSTNNLKITNYNSGDETISSDLFEKYCERNINKNSLNETNELITTCTIFLPKSEMNEYTGKVIYGRGTTKGINNKHYTSLTYKGDYPIKMDINGLNILKDSTLTTDGLNGVKWTGNWTQTINDCNINVYSLLEEPNNDKKTANYKFIYRPIDINNPFPNRNAGVNWYEWYKKDSNKKRLEESYSNLEYKIKLDSSEIIKIKNYNRGKNYLDWDGINSNNESSFVREYFKCKNGTGDCS